MEKTYSEQLKQYIEEMDSLTFLQVHRGFKSTLNKLKIAQSSIENQCDKLTSNYVNGVIEDFEKAISNYEYRITNGDLWRGETGEEHPELTDEELNKEVF